MKPDAAKMESRGNHARFLARAWTAPRRPAPKGGRIALLTYLEAVSTFPGLADPTVRICKPHPNAGLNMARKTPRTDSPQARHASGNTGRRLSMAELEEGRRIAALVVKHCGELYMPIFERFDRAITERQDAQDRLTLVLNSQAPIQHVPRRTRRTARPNKNGQSS